MVNRLSGKRSKPKAKSNFVYRKRTEAEIKARQEMSSGRFDSPFKGNFDLWRAKQGDNLIRILPPTWDDHHHFGFDIWMHGFVGPDKSSYICPAKMKQKHCPICEAAREASQAGEQDEARALSVQRKVVVWIIDRDADSETPQLWLMSNAQDKEILARQHSKRSGKLYHIDHPDEGFDISIQRTGAGLKTRYVIQIERDPSQISDDADKQEEILAFIEEHKLPDILKFYDSEHLERVISGTTPEKDEDLDEDESDDEEAPKKKKKAAKPSRDNDEDEDEEDEKPRKSKRHRSTDDDDGDDEDEEGEDEKPVKRGSRRPAKEEAEDEDEVEDDEEEEKPAKKKSKARHEDDDEEEADESEEDTDEVEDEDEDEKPRHKSKHKKPARDEDESDDEDEDNDDLEEDEEDEQPAKKKSATRVRTKTRHEDDDEEESDDEDEEEDQPRRRVKTRH